MFRTLSSFLLAFTIVAPAFAAETSPVIAPVLQPFVDRHALAGAVTLVASKDQVLDLEAVGFADIGANKPLHTDALFWIASQSKPITAAAFMMLVDEGKVNVDDPVEKYLPEFKGQLLVVEKDADHTLLKKPEHPIRIRDILTHTSGLPFSTPVETPTLDMLPLRTAVRSYAMSPLQFAPESKYQYANAGINTAGRIIEVVSNMPYEKFLDERLFQPLGMKDTTFRPNEDQVGRLAKSYKPNADKTALEETTITQLHYPLSDDLRQPMPAGGLFSTAEDLAKFCQMILNGGELNGRRYLSAAAVQQMTSKQTPEAVSTGYGFGWSVNGQTCGHGGAYSTDMSIDRQHGLITIYMVQHAGFAGDGEKARGAFTHAAVERFANAAPK
jgi:CubicO group peptidase (beta-lactamase class C family)